MIYDQYTEHNENMKRTSTSDNLVPTSHSSSVETIPISSEPSLPEITILPEILARTNNNFYCCCGRLHVYIVAKFLLIYHTLLLTLLILAFFYESVALLGPMFVLFGTTAYALFRTKPEWLWPFIIYTGCSTIIFILFSAYLFFYSTLNNQNSVEEIVISSVVGRASTSTIPYLLPFIIHLFNILLCIFHSWQVIVLLSTRRFLKRVWIVKREQLFRRESIQTTISCE